MNETTKFLLEHCNRLNQWVKVGIFDTMEEVLEFKETLKAADFLKPELDGLFLEDQKILYERHIKFLNLELERNLVSMANAFIKGSTAQCKVYTDQIETLDKKRNTTFEEWFVNPHRGPKITREEWDELYFVNLSEDRFKVTEIPTPPNPREWYLKASSLT